MIINFCILVFHKTKTKNTFSKIYFVAFDWLLNFGASIVSTPSSFFFFRGTTSSNGLDNTFN